MVLAVVNFIGITESVVANMVMTFVEVAGLLIVMVIGIVYVVQGKADFGTLGQFNTGDTNPVFAVIAGVALAFFAMTGFENAANVAEETINPAKTFPRALVGGMVAAGVIYVLVADDRGAHRRRSARWPTPTPRCSRSSRPASCRCRSGIMTILFAVIAMVAITNTTLVAVVTQSRILYGMAKEDVVPGVFGKIHASRRSPWVAPDLRGRRRVRPAGPRHAARPGRHRRRRRRGRPPGHRDRGLHAVHLRAGDRLRAQDARPRRGRGHASWPAPRCSGVGIVGNLVLLVYVVVDDPASLLWCAGLLALGGLLFVAEYFFGTRDRAAGRGARHPGRPPTARRI